MAGVSETLDSQIEAPETRLIGNNRTGYVLMSGVSLIGAFLASALLGAGAGIFTLAMLGGIVTYGLLNMAGALRPKMLLLSSAGARYRPVIGRERFVRWETMKSVDQVAIDYGLGVLTYRDVSGRSHGLGLWVGIDDVVRDVERWRLDHP